MEITNSVIIDFYDKHKNINFEEINLLIIGLITNIIQDGEIKLTHTIKTELLQEIKKGQDDLQKMNNNIKQLELVLINKIYETKTNNINEIKDIFKNNISNDQKDISKLIENNNTNLYNHIGIILSNNNNGNINKIMGIINTFNNDVINIIKNNNSTEIASILERKYETLMSNIKKELVDNIGNSENRINHHLDKITNITTESKCIIDLQNKEITNYFNKFNNSSNKGLIGEKKINLILNKLLPSAEIINTSKSTSQGDFIIKREHKTNILIETKDYNKNVPKKEIEKFIHDIRINKIHGIFLSQNSGISKKGDYQIDIINNNIMIYLHNVDYQSDKIHSAIKLIDVLFSQIQLHQDKKISITQDLLNNIASDYKLFLANRQNMIISLKEFYKKQLYMLSDFKIDHLENLISINKSDCKTDCLICPICNKYKTTTLRSLANHKRYCKKKHNIELNSSDSSVEL
jgi:hypothetical protein